MSRTDCFLGPDTIFINTPTLKWKGLKKQSWANAVEGQIIIRADGWCC